MNIAGKAVEGDEVADGHSRERLVGRASPTQLLADQSPSTRYRISALLSLLVLPTVHAAPETAPSEGWDNFANNLGSDLAPLLALFGEQVTIQYLSEALSPLDCLLFALAPLGIITAMVSAIRVAGSPLLRSLVGRAKESRGTVEADLMSSTSADVCELWNGEGVVRVLGRPVLLQLVCFGDDEEGIYTFRDAVKRNLYHPQDGVARTDVELAPLSGDSGGIELLQALEKPPNLSLNVSVKPLDRRLLVAFVCFGVLLQSGVIAYAAIAQYKLKLKKNDQAPVAYGIYVLAAGTISLAVGSFACAMIVERSTTELSWVPVRKETSRSVIWLQQGGQTVGDQRFESFARVIHQKDNIILTSHKSVKIVVDTEDPFDEETDTTQVSAPATKRFGTSVLVGAAVTTSFLGFIIQFLGLRVMHSTVTIAQLAAILIMTALRSCAYIQRENRNDIKNPDQVEGHELDWLAENLTNCQEWQVRTKPRESGWEAGELAIAANRVMKYRARLAKLSEDWELNVRKTTDTLQVVVEATINDVFAKMTLAPEVTGTFEWNIPVQARLKEKAMEFGYITLKLTRSMDENSNWRAWEIEKSELEAVLSLWVFFITKVARRRNRMNHKPLKHVWLLDVATQEAMINHRLWIHRGTTPKSIPLDSESLYFGWTSTSNVDSAVTAGNPTQYLAVERADPLVSLCAQGLYTSFLFNLASKITNVGGVTARRTEESSAVGSRDHWSQFRLNNSNLASLALIYNESFPGTVETAYFSIIPAFSAAKRLPYPHEAYKEARAASATLAKRERWEQAIEIDMWLYSNSKQTAFNLSDVAVMTNEITGRLRKLTEELCDRCIKMGDEVDEKFNQLWSAGYSLFRLITESSADQAACAMNLYVSRRIVKPVTEVEVLYHAARNYLGSLTLKHHTRKYILFTLYTSRKGRLLLDDTIDHYFGDPASVLQAATITLRSKYDTIQRLLVPKELVLVECFRTPLQFASEIGDASMVQQLLAAGADIEAGPGAHYGRTALQAAAGTGNKDIVELLLSAHANVNADPGSYHGRTALQAASGAGHKDIVELLLSANAKVNADPGADHGRTALQAASGAGHEDIVELLLSAHANVNADPGLYLGRTALQAASGAGHKDIVKLLLSANAKVIANPGQHHGRTALQAASGGGHSDIVELLLPAHAQSSYDQGQYCSSIALQAAAEGGYLGIVDQLLEKGANVNATSSGVPSKRALQAAASGGHLAVVDRLLEKGADVNAESSDMLGKTALQDAASGGHLAVVDRLLEKGADATESAALQSAARGGHLDVVDRLLQAGANVNARRDKYTETALRAAAAGGHLRVVDRLIEKGANVNASPGDPEDRTSLAAAVRGGHLAVVDRLLEKGATDTVNAALEAAASLGYLAVVNRLLEAGVDVNVKPTGYSPTVLEAAARGGHLAVVNQLLEKGADDTNSAAFGAAASFGCLAVVNRLLEAGADVNAKPSISYLSALENAALGGHLSVVDRLLEKGADVNGETSNYDGRTALQAAASGGHLAVVNRLLEKGADVNAKPSKYNGSALQAAASGGHLAVVNRLLEKGADGIDIGALKAAESRGDRHVLDRLRKAGEIE